MLTAGDIVAPIHAAVTLSEIALGHDLVDTKSTIGNVVVTMPEATLSQAATDNAMRRTAMVRRISRVSQAHLG